MNIRVTGAICGLAVLLLLGGCVTETTGGFNGERSPEKALENYLQLSVGYLERGDLASAKRHLHNAADFAPGNSEVLGVWGLIYAQEGEAQLAEESFRRSLRADSRNSQVRNNYAAFLFAADRFAEASEQLRRVTRDASYPGRALAYENLGLTALRLNQPEEAESAFARAVQLDGQLFRANLELAALLMRRGDLLGAQSHYGDYLALSKTFNVGHNARSLWIGIQLQRALGNEDGVSEYGEALKADFSASAEYALYQQVLNDGD